MLWDNYFGVLADVAGRAGFATVLVAVAGGRIVGTATVELDRTIDGTGGLQPGQANLRLLAGGPGARHTSLSNSRGSSVSWAFDESRNGSCRLR